MVVHTSPFTEGRPDQFQGSYRIVPCLQMSVLDKELCHQGKVRGMLGVHCRTTPYMTFGLPILATFQLTFCLSAMRSSRLVFSKEN